jgi:hypothetical protein
VNRTIFHHARILREFSGKRECNKTFPGANQAGSGASKLKITKTLRFPLHLFKISFKIRLIGQSSVARCQSQNKQIIPVHQPFAYNSTRDKSISAADNQRLTTDKTL